VPKLAEPAKRTRAGFDGRLEYDAIAQELFLRGHFSAVPSATTVSRLERSALAKLRKRLGAATDLDLFRPQ
jgi:hypothetical protein